MVEEVANFAFERADGPKGRVHRLAPLDAWLAAAPRGLVIALGLTLILLVGAVDGVIGVEVSTSIFYVAPISLVTWYAGRRAGLYLAFVAAAVWMLTDRLWDLRYSHISIQFWNAGVRLAIFVLIAVLLSEVRMLLRQVQESARRDGLTGLLNARAFHFELAEELRRLQRFQRPFSLAYIDLDNFKRVNDRRGHGEGDSVLRRVADVLSHCARETDRVARLGGDEFAVLLVETPAEVGARAVAHLQRNLLEEMEKGGWPVGFSVGVVTFETAPASAGEALAVADGIMYGVKRAHKGALQQALWRDGELLETAPLRVEPQ